jgi:hypothetical protein
MNAHQYQILGRKEKSRSRYGQLEKSPAENGFLCAHCHGFVSTESGFSGVQNRNHCPYCLWSRHLDLYAGGDRLSACKAMMEPIGLTLKATRKKYGPCRSELMLIHSCKECSNLSINRIAADDDSQTVFTIFEGSFRLDVSTQARLVACGIRAIDEADRDTVHGQLFGHRSDPADIFFKSSPLEFV